MLTQAMREQVRQQARFACEYCGVTETDTAGLLTVDHFRPQAHGGEHTLDNLLYCCPRCNLYKADYWSQSDEAPTLWHPRKENAETHFIEIVNGSLYPLTPKGTFTLTRLRLNRPQLVAYRLQKREQKEQLRLITRYESVISMQEKLSLQQSEFLLEQRLLLDELQKVIVLLIHKVR